MQGQSRPWGSVWHDEEQISACWDCGIELTGADGVGGTDHPPAPGDVSLCIYCEALSIFTGKGLEMRKPTEEESREAEADPDIIRARPVVARVRDAMIRDGNPRVRPREADDAPRDP
jgi:hypothetical protein